MATVTGLTAAKMQEYVDANVVDGNIVGDDLILVTNDASQINAGNVRGPQGIQGSPGEVTDAEMLASLTQIQTNLNTYQITGGSGWLDTATITKIDVTLPALWNSMKVKLEAEWRIRTSNFSNGAPYMTRFYNQTDTTALRSTQLGALQVYDAPINPFEYIIRNMDIMTGLTAGKEIRLQINYGSFGNVATRYDSIFVATKYRVT